MSDFTYVSLMTSLKEGDGGFINQLIRDRLRFKQFLFMVKAITIEVINKKSGGKTSFNANNLKS